MLDSRVRLATSKDVNDLIDLVKEAHAEEHLGPSATLSEERVFEVILQALSGQAVIGVIGEPGEIQSSAYISIARPWYSATPVLSNLFFYTRPDHRKSSNSKSLLTWTRQQADRLGAPLQMEASASELGKPKAALLQRILGEPAGLSFFYQPNPDAPTEVAEVEVEPASIRDEGDVINVARELAAENGAYATAEDLAIPLLHEALDGNGCIGLIRGEDKQIQATIFLKVSSSWYSEDPFLDEFFLYCRPEYRKSNNAKSLIQFAKRQSDRLDLPLRIGIISKIEIARKTAMYRRLLGAESCAHFLYRPEAS
jgi:hypothetical protein